MALTNSRFGRLASAANPLRIWRLAVDLWQNGRRAAQESGVSVLRVMYEQVALYLLNNLNRKEYYMYRLHDPGFSWGEKRAVIGDRSTSKYFRVLVPPRYHFLFKDKLAFDRFYRGAGLPLPDLYGVFHPEWGWAEGGGRLRTAEDLGHLLDERGIDEFVLKPVASTWGFMILALRRKGGSYVGPDGTEYSPVDLVDFMQDEERLAEAYDGAEKPLRAFLLQERLRPPGQLQHFTEETLCTVRVMTVVKTDGEVEILGAAFKLPGVDRGVDNLSQGGVCIGIDVDAGRLLDGVLYKTLPPTRYRTHPITGKEFYGFQLPQWNRIKGTAVEAARVFPTARAIGWDIAPTPRGPVLLEGNYHWGVEIPQQAYQEGLMKGSFKETYQALARRHA